MKKNNLKISVLFRSLSLLIVFMLVIPAFSNGQVKPDFSGKWAFNTEKSTLGEGGARFGGGDIVVKQEANLLTVERTRTNRDGETTTTTSKYSLDGKESVNSTGRGESKSTAKWSADGKTLTITTTSSFNGNERTSTEAWSMADAKTLSITSVRQGRDGQEMKTTRVYDKK